MDAVKARYVFKYYGHLMTEHERLAFRHLITTAKATRGRTDVEAQTEAKDSTRRLRELRHMRDTLLDDPSVLLLARDGIEAFILRTGRRILKEHPDRIAFNCCPRCGRLARTPTARQCRFCGHDWHNEVGPQTTDQE
jgi:hypothetical protein